MTVALDAWAALALLLGERGADRVAKASADAAFLAVNLAEARQRLAHRSVAPRPLDAAHALYSGRVAPFTEAQAYNAARLAAPTLGLSLGDRACLALARSLGASVMTADRACAGLDVGVTVEVIR